MITDREAVAHLIEELTLIEAIHEALENHRETERKLGALVEIHEEHQNKLYPNYQNHEFDR